MDSGRGNEQHFARLADDAGGEDHLPGEQSKLAVEAAGARRGDQLVALFGAVDDRGLATEDDDEG